MVSACPPVSTSVPTAAPPLDFSGVTLERAAMEFEAIENSHPMAPPEDRQYVNFCANGKWILSEFPHVSPYSQDDFWHCVIENDVDLIMMLSQENEPQAPPHYLNDPSLSICYNVKRESVVLEGDFLKSKIEISRKIGAPLRRSVSHVQCLHWQDGWIIPPSDIAQLAQLVIDASKPLVHCRGGVGRTGVVAATGLVCLNIQNGDHKPDVVKRTVRKLREERSGCVQSYLQYACVYAASGLLVRKQNPSPKG